MIEIPEAIWSNTDYPYICLLDKKRTEAFRQAINEVVKSGDIVVEVGAGTGILSMFAIAAGASRVYAVEFDPILARSLKETARANGCEDKLTVIAGDAMKVDLPQNVDVVIGELIETGLLDEMQVVVMNSLRERGVIGTNTQLVPQAYETSLQLVDANDTFYGFHIAAPKHDWPYYSDDRTTWAQLEITQASELQNVGQYDFQAGIVDPRVDTVLEFNIPEGMSANSFRLSGTAQLSNSVSLGATNSFSGDKVLPLPNGPYQGQVKLHVRYVMSTGLANLQVSRQ